MSFKLPTGRGKNRDRQLMEFASGLINLANRIGFKVSSRGWCYVLEGEGLIDKSRFDRVENLINELRKRGGLPIDFVAEEEARKFSGVVIPETMSPIEYMREFLKAVTECEYYYKPNWWRDEEFYIQMIVEKIDVKTLFQKVCAEYHIPIATTKGWSSMLQRATYSRRFSEAEDKGLKCVLLYCGDHDPDGLRISDFLRSNLRDLSVIRWIDGTRGYNPRDLIIERFGLDYDYIEENNLAWIDNLITGSGKNLASPRHPNFNMPYVQDYLSEYGERKCEANALLKIRTQAHQLCRDAIEKYLGERALKRFQAIRGEIVSEVEGFRERTGLDEAIEEAINIIDGEEE